MASLLGLLLFVGYIFYTPISAAVATMKMDSGELPGLITDSESAAMEKLRPISNVLGSKSTIMETQRPVSNVGGSESAITETQRPVINVQGSESATMETQRPVSNVQGRESAIMEKLRANSYAQDLSSIDIKSLSANQMLLTIHSYLDNVDTVCRRKLRMGKIGDGGWEICDDPDVRPRIPCIIYSFGINYDFSFDDDAARVYQCHVYAFDPSMRRMKTSQRSERVNFYRIGLSGNTSTAEKGWELKTLQGIREDLNHHNATIDVLKMDIENSEWSAVPQMVASGQLDSVRQLLIEFHVKTKSTANTLSRLQVIKAIEKAGFKRFYVHKNIHCSRQVPGYPVVRTLCYEVHYIKRP